MVSRMAGRVVTGPVAFLLAWVVDVIALAIELRRRRSSTEASLPPPV